MDVEADLLMELRALAGIRGKDSTFTMKHEGVTFEVEYSGGSSSSLTLRARYDAVARAIESTSGREAHYRASAKGAASIAGIRPMKIKLRDEDADDRSAKMDGINVEHQTGDEAFDAAVYIESPTTDPALLCQVLSADVRAAARALLSLAFDSVVIDDDGGHVTAHLSAFLKLRDVPDRAERVASAFAKLCSGLPKVAHSGGAHPARSALPTVLAVTGALGLFVFGPIGYLGIASGFGCTESSSDGEGVSVKDECGGVGFPALGVAILVGAVVAWIAGAIATPRLAGHSDSKKRIRVVMAACATWCMLAALLLVAFTGFASLRK